MLIPFDLKSGQPNWGALQDTSLGDFQLQDFLGADATSAVFQAEVTGKPGSSAVLKFYKVDQDSVAENQTEVWLEARALNHPNLIRVMGAGRLSLADDKLIYVAVEPADESLSSALRERRLESSEAAEVLTSAKSALQYLHGHGFVHSCLSPEQIFAVGDAIKLSTEGLRKPGPAQRLLASNPKYVAPESDEANTTRASDVWCLGATLLEALTLQNVSAGNWSAHSVPESLRSVVQRCLNSDPNLRATLSQLEPMESAAQQSKPILQAPEPVATPYVVRPEPPKTLYPRKPARSGLPVWAYAIASVVLIGVLVWLFRPASTEQKATATSAKPVPAAQQKVIQPSGESTPAPQPPVVKPSPKHTAAPQTRPQPSQPAQESASTSASNGNIWRVIVYTYSQESAAKNRVAEINEKNPQLKAEAFSPDGKSPFLVTVGGPMSREDAKRFRQTAVHSGMPRDSYTQNFAK